MSASLERLLSNWRNLDLTNPPYVLSEDQRVFKKANTPFSFFPSFTDWHTHKDFGQRQSHEFQTGLLPIPYFGDLRKARIFLLTLNPGFDHSDIHAETVSPELRRDLIKNLHQSDLDPQYPSVFLNPKYSWHGGFIYWAKKLQGILSLIQKANGFTYRDSLAFLAKNIAVLEAVPYHSIEFKGSNNLLENLQSSRAIKEFVNDLLSHRAASQEALIIVLRKNSFWGLKESSNVVIYGQGEARGSSLTPNSRGGKAMADFLRTL